MKKGLLLLAYQEWPEIRRNGYSLLPWIEGAGFLQSSLPPNHLLYPVEEGTLNSLDDAAGKVEDSLNTKMFRDVKWTGNKRIFFLSNLRGVFVTFFFKPVLFHQ